MQTNSGSDPEFGLALNTCNPHLLVDDPAAVDDHLAVELDGAVAQRHVVVAAGVALAPALRVRTGREKKVAREGTRGGPVALALCGLCRSGQC